jgi:uncharacterized membrane protein
MNRADFMKQLERLLQNISQAEREEALQYYNDYFDDAGAENEQAVIEALGNPARVAENIKKDLFGNSAEKVKVTAGDRVMVPYGESEAQGIDEKAAYETASSHTEKSNNKKGKFSPGIIVLIVVLSILASPILLPVAGALLGVVVSIIAVIVALLVVWFALIIAFGAVAVSLVVTAVVLAVVSVIIFFGHPLIGLSVLGVGLLCGGIGLLFLMLTVCMAGVVTPAFWRLGGKLMGKLFGSNKAKKTV